MCSKITIKTPGRRRRRTGVFIVDFEQVNVCWERTASAEIRVFINNFDRVFACWAMNLLQNHSILF